MYETVVVVEVTGEPVGVGVPTGVAVAHWE